MTAAEETYRTYWDRGWTVVPDVFSENEIDPIARLAMATAINEQPDASTVDAEVDLDENGQFLPRKVNWPFTKDEHFRRFALNLQLRELLAGIIGKPVLLLFDQVFLKPPRHGSAKPYHQDNAYFLCHPDDEVITAWIALDDVDEANGCLRYIDGSHRLPILAHNEIKGEKYNLMPDETDIDFSRESLAPVKKGGVVLHHSKALHTSHRNTSNRWRRAYATHWATADVVSEVNTIERAYFNQHADLYADVLQS
jgi:phytanoyl-CoA hydroxylase